MISETRAKSSAIAMAEKALRWRGLLARCERYAEMMKAMIAMP